jgi:hypothetical protein
MRHIPSWPIELDTNECGHVIVDQPDILGKVYLTPEQIGEIVQFAKEHMSWLVLTPSKL